MTGLPVAVGAVVWGGVVATFAAGKASRLTWIDVLLLFGALVIVPLAATAAPWRDRAVEACVGSALLLVPSLALARGPAAAALTAPWVVTAAVVAWTALRPMWGERRGLDAGQVADGAAAGWFVVAAASLPVSRMGWSVLGLEEPIIELTSVHYTFAGVATSLIAAMAWRRASSRAAKHVATVGVALVVGAPPVVATGFFTNAALPQVGGAVLLTVGVYAIAFVLLTSVRDRDDDGLAKALLVVAALSIVAPMVLAVGWAAAQHMRLRALSIPDMARIHGTMNALGWSLCGLAARTRTKCTPDRRVFVDSV